MIRILSAVRQALTQFLVLGDQGRSFRRVFTLAQKQLRAIWGMELRELPVREKMSLQEKRQGMRLENHPSLVGLTRSQP